MRTARPRPEPLMAPMGPLDAADRLVSLSAMVIAAARAGERERLVALVERSVRVVVGHLGEAGPSMWTESEGALWRTLHRALVDAARGVVRAVHRDERVPETAEHLGFVALRYRSAVARRSVRATYDESALAVVHGAHTVA